MLYVANMIVEYLRIRDHHGLLKKTLPLFDLEILARAGGGGIEGQPDESVGGLKSRNPEIHPWKFSVNRPRSSFCWNLTHAADR